MSPSPLVTALLSPDAYPHPVDGVRLIETHISWVLLAGDHAYKIKKPLDLGFLDFSSLDRRRFCCEEEIRLNRRLAPDIYLSAVPITGTPDAPRIGGAGPALEWAVAMRAFPADATLDRGEARVTADRIDAIAERVARFHGEIDPAPAGSDFGTPESVMYPVRENFRQIRECRPPAGSLALVARIEAWSEAAGGRLAGHFATRRAAGFVRECHGDLHLGNIAWAEEAPGPGAPIIFDCIEFNPRLRFIDVASEVAFLFMDLVSRARAGLAWRFLNRWLESTGDYAGLPALRFYAVYRAMVRSKVAFIRAGQGDADSLAEAERQLRLAESLGQPARPFLLLMHGFSGSGKSWLSQQLLEELGAARLRSDVERKRLFDLAALADSGSAVAGGIYGPEATARTFRRLLELAGEILDAGHPVIVDATFLTRALRAPFLDMAGQRGVPTRIVSLRADERVLRERIAARERSGGDASEAGLAVLEAQLRQHDPLRPEELALTVFADASSPAPLHGLSEALRVALR